MTAFYQRLRETLTPQRSGEGTREALELDFVYTKALLVRLIPHPAGATFPQGIKYRPLLKKSLKTALRASENQRRGSGTGTRAKDT